MINFTEKVTELGRSDPIVHAALQGYAHHRYTYLEALEMMVVELVAIKNQQAATLIEIATRAPGPGVLR